MQHRQTRKPRLFRSRSPLGPRAESPHPPVPSSPPQSPTQPGTASPLAEKPQWT
jgi:hypothetical protein